MGNQFINAIASGPIDFSIEFTPSLYRPGASLVAQMGKNLIAMQETWIQSLSWEDPLENRMTTHSSIFV